MKVKITSILEYILVVIMILQCNSIYIHKENNYNFGTIFLVIIISLVVIKLSGVKLKDQTSKNLFIFLGAYILLISLVFVMNYQAMPISYIILYIVIFPLLVILLTLYKSKNDLIKLLLKFVNIVVFFSIVSLVFWLLGSQFNIIKPTNIVLNKWAGMYYVNSYYDIYFETQRIILPSMNIIRNSGMFVEAPMWNVVLSTAFIFEKFINLRKNKWILTILVITIASTVSTTGIYIVGLSYIYFFIFRKKDKLSLIFLTLIPIIIYFLIGELNKKVTSSSGSIRADDYRAGLLALKDSIMIGHGSLGLSVIQSYMNSNIRPSLGYSNGIFVILATGGIIMASLLLFWVIWMFLSFQVNKNLKFSSGLFIILLVTTIYDKSYIFLFCCALGYTYFLSQLTNNKVRKKNEENRSI